MGDRTSEMIRATTVFRRLLYSLNISHSYHRSVSSYKCKGSLNWAEQCHSSIRNEHLQKFLQYTKICIFLQFNLLPPCSRLQGIQSRLTNITIRKKILLISWSSLSVVNQDINGTRNIFPTQCLVNIKLTSKNQSSHFCWRAFSFTSQH